MKFSAGTTHDTAFLTEAIFSAVKSGTDVLSYSTLFELDEEQLKPLFTQMLEEEVEGQELWPAGFLIARDEDGTPAATCCAWVEGEEGPSAMLTAQLLSYYLGKEAYMKAHEKTDVIESLRVDGEEGALQIEHVYTAPAYRGKGIAAEVIRQQINRYKKEYPELKKVQVILFDTNENALKAYTKLGFKIALEKRSSHPDVLKYFPSDTRILMEMPAS